MLVGKSENNIPFYVKQGCDKYERTIKNYFVDNYDEEILGWRFKMCLYVLLFKRFE